jgi:hypothetical protein
MLGHLVSNFREAPPNFGIAALLRAARRGFQALSHGLISLPGETLLHPRKQPAHPQ